MVYDDHQAAVTHSKRFSHASLPSEMTRAPTGGAATGGDNEPSQSGLTAIVVKYYRISILLVCALLVGGVWSLVTLPRAEDPEFDVQIMRVLTT